MGGSLRLGANEINVKPDTIANKIYGQDKISKDIDIDMNLIQNI